MTTVTVAVRGMTCNGCVNSVTKALQNVAGVTSVDVSLEAGQATVQFDETRVSETDLQQAIEDAGYDVA